jgi:hypothetical protein
MERSKVLNLAHNYGGRFMKLVTVCQHKSSLRALRGRIIQIQVAVTRFASCYQKRRRGCEAERERAHG